MVTAQQTVQSSLSRVWLTPFSAGPGNQPSYEGLARADTPEWSLGDITPIHIPDCGAGSDGLGGRRDLIEVTRVDPEDGRPGIQRQTGAYARTCHQNLRILRLR